MFLVPCFTLFIVTVIFSCKTVCQIPIFVDVYLTFNGDFLKSHGQGERERDENSYEES